MARQVIYTEAAPKAIGTCPQAVRCGATAYLTDLGPFAPVNETMARHFSPPCPARATLMEMDAIMHLE